MQARVYQNYYLPPRPSATPPKKGGEFMDNRANSIYSTPPWLRRGLRGGWIK